MANIAMVVSSTSHSGTAITKTMLEGLGHTVTLYNEAAVTVANMIVSDVVVTNRTGNAKVYSDKIASAFKQGTPILVGATGGVPFPALNTVGHSCSIFSGGVTSPADSPTQDRGFKTINHEIFDGLGVDGADGVAEVIYHNSKNYSISIPLTIIAPSIKSLLFRPDLIDTSLMLVGVKGDLGFDNLPYAANIVAIPWVYGTGGYTPLGSNIVKQSIEWLLAGAKQFKGTITDASGNLTARKVTAMYRDRDFIAATTNSNALGEYTLNLANGREYTLLSVSPTKNAIVYDRL